MKSIVVFGGRQPWPGIGGGPTHLDHVTVSALKLRCGVVEQSVPAFDASSVRHRNLVLLRTRAFSCNYRDQTFLYQMKDAPAHRFITFGSEFMGDVCEVGGNVTTLKPGDRVVSNHHYTGQTMDQDGVLEGVATNRASKEYHLIHPKKLVPLPARMPDEVAAAFSLSAQTAYSMVRKMAVEPGMNVLVTSARSNTSLFIIAALQHSGATVYAATTSGQFIDRLLTLGADEVLLFDRNGASFTHSDLINRKAETIGMFHRVFDPFYDLHLDKAVDVMAPFGRYITCGLARQNPGLIPEGQPYEPIKGGKVIGAAMLKNLTILGNCIGLRSDLERALEDYTAGRLDVVVDSVFSGSDVRPFLDRTYNDRSRFGKVVYRFS